MRRLRQRGGDDVVTWNRCHFLGELWMRHRSGWLVFNQCATIKAKDYMPLLCHGLPKQDPLLPEQGKAHPLGQRSHVEHDTRKIYELHSPSAIAKFHLWSGFDSMQQAARISGFNASTKFMDTFFGILRRG